MTSKKKKTIRKPGELTRLVGEYLKEHPEARYNQVAADLGLTYANAKNAVQRVRREFQKSEWVLRADPPRVQGSALDTLVSEAVKCKKKIRISIDLNEQMFLAVVGLVGLPRAESLLKDEKARIQGLLKGTLKGAVV